MKDIKRTHYGVRLPRGPKLWLLTLAAKVYDRIELRRQREHDR